jgi:peptidoglycan/xylan/chitin deacetylase (PgdA/CDA1 family)
MKKLNMVWGIVIFLSACTGMTSTPINSPTGTAPALPPVQYFTVTATVSPTPTLTRSPTSTPTWIAWGPGDVRIPILLYHHIGASPVESRYYVPVELFEQELKVLQDLGYTTITVEQLVDAITKGCKLPEHPIMITFDDGNLDNYTKAFPIMQKYGFTGVLYIVANYLGVDGYLSREQILEMHEAGWSIGSHGLSHKDLTTLSPEDQKNEIAWSKKFLEKELGIDILTFAYPFGAKNNAMIGLVRQSGYIAAMGAEGYKDSQGTWNLFNLQRVEVKATENAESFTRFLTWQGEAR